MKGPIWARTNESRRKMKSSFPLAVLFSVLFGFAANSQNNPTAYHLLFYNVENLFDPENDAQTEDDDFTPDGGRYWNYNRLSEKLNNISKVILSASGWNPPEMIGLCEVENRNVLEKLLHQTPLKNFPYKFIHKDSPDDRGIDVAFIYNEEIFYPLNYQYIPLKNKNDELVKSREILYVSGVLNKTDTLHLFVNHWPSRYSGLLETRQKRNLAANILKEKTEEVFKNRPSAKIIIMGDFNDQPTDESVTKHMNATPVSNQIAPRKLYNLSANWINEEKGTLKYQSQWYVFDQFIVSGTLLAKNSGLTTEKENASIVAFDYLLEQDERYGGIKPNRTYTGFKYNGGFSDHLPILLKLNADN